MFGGHGLERQSDGLFPTILKYGRVATNVRTQHLIGCTLCVRFSNPSRSCAEREWSPIINKY